MPQIGIFWVHAGEVLAESSPLVDSVDNGRFIDHPSSHVATWPSVQARCRKRFPELAFLEYEEVPRGRLLYDRRHNRFLCYLDRLIDRPEIRRQLIDVFQLSGQSVVFGRDPHYTTDASDLDHLFDD